jgi:O-antigen ligase
MSLLPDLCLVAIVLIAPFREGGREPVALLMLHLIAALLVVGSFWIRGLPRPLPRATVVPAAAALGLAAVSAWRADYPFAAWLGFVDLAVVLLVFAAALVRGRRPGRASLVRAAVVAAALGQALLVFVRYRSGGVMAAGASFLNPNHLAAFLNIAIAIALAAVVDARARGSAPAAARRAVGGWAAVVATLLAAVLLLGSRGALLGLLAMTGLFLLLRWRSWGRAWRVAACALVGCMAVAGAARIVLRFAAADDPFRYHRVAIWRAAIGMIADRPLTGFGPGMFPHLASARNFPIDTGPLRYERRFDGAHAAPLTLAAEIGLPAAALALAAAIGVIVALLSRRAGGPAAGPAATGVALAIAGLVAQGCVEDLHRRPALVLVPALLAGTALGARRRDDEDPARPPEGAPAGAGIRGWPAAGRAAAIVAVVYGVGLGVVLPWIAHQEAEAARRSGPAGIDRMRRAARLAPLQPEYRHDLAMAAINSGPPTAEAYAEAWRLIAEARRLKPIDPRFPLLLGRLETIAGNRLFHDRGAPGRAVALYREAIALSPHDPRPRLELGHYLIETDDLPGALAEARAALEVEPHFVRARILEASVLARLGRGAEAAAARAALEATLGVVRGFNPGSGYGREIVQDAPESRARLDDLLRGAPAPG